MAPQKKTAKSSTRRRNRKARTEVSSDSSSSDPDSAADSPPQEKRSISKANATKSNLEPLPNATNDTASLETQASSSPSPASPQIPSPPQPSAKQDFEQFYLQQATREFGDDLEKLRNAGDFKGARSVEVLVRGLRQGTGCFE